MYSLDKDGVTLGTDWGVVGLSKIDDFRDEGFAEDDIVGFEVEVADAEVCEVHESVHNVEQDEQLAVEGDWLGSIHDVKPQLFALEVLHHYCLMQFRVFVDDSEVLRQKIRALTL